MGLPNLKQIDERAMSDLFGQARKASDLMKALSHESRLLILCLLAEGEKAVSDLENIMEMPQAAVSQQLARLRFDGLVNARREGRSIYYSIASEEVASVVETLHRLFCRPVRPEGALAGNRQTPDQD
jgi:DNA-binding transcriptional ArsR family regulator